MASEVVGIVLAAGVGSRLGELGRETPKCLITIAGKSNLEAQIEAFEHAGIRTVLVVVGHQSQMVRNALEALPNKQDLQIIVIENQEFASSNNFFSLIAALQDLPDRSSAIVINGDIAVELSHFGPLVTHRGASDVLLLSDSDFWSDDAMKIRVDLNGSVTEISKQIPRSVAIATSCDTYILGPDAISWLKIKSQIEFDRLRHLWVESVLDEMCKGTSKKIRTVEVTSKWGEVDDIRDYSRVNLSLSPARLSELRVKAAVFDLDGTLVRAWEPTIGSVEVVRYFRDCGVSVAIVSNNTSIPPEVLKERLVSLGFDEEIEVHTPLPQAVSWMQERNVSRFFPLVNEMITDWFCRKGFSVSSDNPEIVVVGYWTEWDYRTISRACELISLGVPFLVTHPDEAYPGTLGPLPDAGALASLLEKVTGATPSEILGKPTLGILASLPPIYFEGATVLVGDRLKTDMEMGRKIGFRTIWLTTADELAESAGSRGVDFVISDLGVLLESQVRGAR